MSPKLKIYISSSWKNRDRVRKLAEGIREAGHEVYDFTDPASREGIKEIPPEMFPKNFNPEKDNYREYLNSRPEWRQAVERNRVALHWCNTVIMLLPCGDDAHADAFYGLGHGAALAIVGSPKAGDRTPTHLWAHALLDSDDEVIPWVKSIARNGDLWTRST